MRARGSPTLGSTNPSEVVMAAKRPDFRRISGNLDLEDPVFHPHGKRVDRLDRRKGQRAPGADVDVRTVPRTDRDPFLRVEVALAERTVVVRAAVLERVVLAIEVVDPERKRTGVD